MRQPAITSKASIVSIFFILMVFGNLSEAQTGKIIKVTDKKVIVEFEDPKATEDLSVGDAMVVPTDGHIEKYGNPSGYLPAQGERLHGMTWKFSNVTLSSGGTTASETKLDLGYQRNMGSFAPGVSYSSSSTTGSTSQSELDVSIQFNFTPNTIDNTLIPFAKVNLGSLSVKSSTSSSISGSYSGADVGVMFFPQKGAFGAIFALSGGSYSLQGVSISGSGISSGWIYYFN